jgi:hypothetical protein
MFAAQIPALDFLTVKDAVWPGATPARLSAGIVAPLPSNQEKTRVRFGDLKCAANSVCPHTKARNGARPCRSAQRLRSSSTAWGACLRCAVRTRARALAYSQSHRRSRPCRIVENKTYEIGMINGLHTFHGLGRDHDGKQG